MATQQEIAKHLFLSDRTIREYSKMPGAPKPRGRAGYDIDAWRQFYIEYLRSKASEGSAPQLPETDDVEQKREAERKEIEHESKKVKLAREKQSLKKQEIANHLAAKKWGPLDLIQHAVESVAVSLKSRIEATLPKLKIKFPDLSMEVIEQLEEQLIEMSNELADVEPDFSDYIDGIEEAGEEGPFGPEAER